MKYSDLLLRTAVPVLAAAGLAFLAPQVFAEETDEAVEADTIEEIVVVEAPIIRRTEVGRRSNTGMSTEIIELSRRVSFADLDLTTHEDVVELENRIREVAHENCETLERMFPFADSDYNDIRRCEKLAIRDAEAQLEELVAAAD